MGLSLKTKRVLAAALVALSCCASASARQGRAVNDVSAGPFNPAPYRVGEHLTYTVSFSNFAVAAHVELSVASRGQLYGREGVELQAHVETVGVISAALYALNNNYVSFVDPSTGLPYRARQEIREGTRIENFTRDYNTPPGESAIPSKQTVASPSASFDLLSALYRLRSLPLAPGAAYTLSVQNGEAVYNVELRVTGRENLKSNLGSSAAIVTQARVRGNPEADSYRVTIYFSDDERHVPLLITARHRAGEIRAEIASAEILQEAQPVSGAPNLAQPAPTQPGIVLPPTTRPGPPAAGGGAAATGVGASVAAPTPAVDPALPFKPGDELNYNFFLGNGPQPIGTASFRVRARARYFNRDGLLFNASLQTAGAGAKLFPVNDLFASYVDASSLLPFRAEQTIAEGQRRARFVVSSDQGSGSALFEDGTRVDIPAGTHDLLSVFFALRSFDLTPGKRTNVSLLVNKRPRVLVITALRRADLSLAGQQIPAVELALATNDPAGDRFNLRLWVSTDKRRLPLRLTAITPLGPVRADLAIIPTALQ
ncbi:MAG TPA: DUF3108 domain-containing protein [Pyrinomonadaceae bacterium]|nr:DUF3108 domain-containing protein [Pyrinomonadaceae bacterium]